MTSPSSPYWENKTDNMIFRRSSQFGLSAFIVLGLQISSGHGFLEDITGSSNQAAESTVQLHREPRSLVGNSLVGGSLKPQFKSSGHLGGQLIRANPDLTPRSGDLGKTFRLGPITINSRNVYEGVLAPDNIAVKLGQIAFSFLFNVIGWSFLTLLFASSFSGNKNIYSTFRSTKSDAMETSRIGEDYDVPVGGIPKAKDLALLEAVVDYDEASNALDKGDSSRGLQEASKVQQLAWERERRILASRGHLLKDGQTLDNLYMRLIRTKSFLEFLSRHSGLALETKASSSTQSTKPAKQVTKRVLGETPASNLGGQP